VEPVVNSVRLDPITGDNVRSVFNLSVAPGQDQFVASNAWSLAQAYALHDIAWPRAIVAGSEVVGFLMLQIDPADEHGHHFFLWRLMVGAAHQRRGIGTAALALALDEVRRRGGIEIFTSWVLGDGSPGLFYERLGFVPTGEVEDGQIVGRLDLDPSARVAG
jgi:diamine N-acetyltransferase